MTEDMEELADVLETLVGIKIDSFLINHYKDGTDCIGAHSDDEAGVHPEYGVLSLTYGAQRTLRLKHKDTSQRFPAANGETPPRSKDFPTKHLHALHMCNLLLGETTKLGNFQSMFTHEIPVQKKVLGPRTSITCRYFSWEEHPDVTAQADAAGIERAPEPSRKRAREE